MDRRHIPDEIKDQLPVGAREEYENALNAAYELYDDPSELGGRTDIDETAHRVAWAAVKRKYEKGNDGRWRSKEDER